MTNLYKLLGRPCVILDFETTGLNPATDRVIEIAAVRWDEQGRHELQTMVRPETIPDPLDPFVTERSGITREMIEQGMPSEQACIELGKFIEGVEVIIGHNVPFDLSFLAAEWDRHHLLHNEWMMDFIDTRALALFTDVGIMRKNRGGYDYLATTLTDVHMAMFDEEPAGAHRAMNDVQAVERILPRLYGMALSRHKPIYNAMTHPTWLVNKGQDRPEYVPPRATVYLTA